MIKKIIQFLSARILYAKLYYQDRKAGLQLKLVQDQTSAINSKSIILCSCIRNEMHRIEHFIEYYRKMGVTHFLLIDNGSDDGLLEWYKNQNDISVFFTESSYKASNFGMYWVNDVLRRYAINKWCIVVDPDEYFVYPNIETRSLKELTQYLDDSDTKSMHAVMLDSYSDKRTFETVLSAGDNPFDVCPYFDRDGYLQSTGWGNSTWIRGGPRLRIHFKDNTNNAPALNKIPLIKWSWEFHYRSSMHDAYPFFLNKAHSNNDIGTTGALFHFKWVSSLEQKSQEEVDRKQHYAEGREYSSYLKNSDECLYTAGISLRYKNSTQLIELGLMSKGNWF